MGLFNRLFGRKSDDKSFGTNPELNKELTQAAAIIIYQMHITKQPMLHFLKEDHGLRERVIHLHLDDPEVKAINVQYGSQTYLSLLGCHALGAGGYITMCQKKFGKNVSEFTSNEISQIEKAFQETDIYELFLDTMGFAHDGNNKHCMDAIVMSCVNTLTGKLGKKACDDNNVADFMRVLFNAGVTVVIR